MNPFTPRAQQVLALARKEAVRLNHAAVGSGHLLLGIIRLHQGTAVNVLSQMIVGELVPLQQEIEKQLGAGSAKTADVPVPYDTSVKRVLAQAGRQAKLINHSYVGTEHLLLGMLIEEGTVKSVLESFGVTHEQARIRALKELDPNISPERLEASGTPLLPILREITSDAILAVALQRHDKVTVQSLRSYAPKMLMR